MRAGESRGLSGGEIALARAMFGDQADWRAVRIVQAPLLGFGAMVPIGRVIIFSRWRAHRDFAAAAPQEQGWFVHELAHVWQAARGVVLAWAKLSAIGKRAYDVTEQPGARFSDFNIEAQAEIARLVFMARAGAEVKAPARTWLEDVWASRSWAGPA